MRELSLPKLRKVLRDCNDVDDSDYLFAPIKEVIEALMTKDIWRNNR